MRCRSVATLWLAFGCACATSDDRRPESGRMDITNGSVSADASVVALLADGLVYCSGTLIADQVVITAGHCAAEVDLPVVFFGADVGGDGVSVPAVLTRAHPLYDPGSLANDVGLVLLAEPAPPAAQAAVASLAPVPSSAVGSLARTVGFGATAGSGDGVGIKRETTAAIGSVNGDELDLVPSPGQPCRGDSGGPVFLPAGAGGELAAVVSRGDTACSEHATARMVADAIESFVEPFLAETAPGAAGVGERCYYPGHCASGMCAPAIDEPMIRMCATACDGSGGCPAPLECIEDADGLALCRHPTPTPGALGWPCDDDADCAVGTCEREVGETAAICTHRCASGAAPCADGFVCRGAEPPAVGDYCFLDDDGGGCATARMPQGLTGIALVLVALGFVRRGRHPRTTCSALSKLFTR